MDGTESASGGEERDAAADDGTSLARLDPQQNQDLVTGVGEGEGEAGGEGNGAGGDISLERPITPGQDAEPEDHTLELIAKYIGVGAGDLQVDREAGQEQDAAQKQDVKEQEQFLEVKGQDVKEKEPEQQHDVKKQNVNEEELKVLQGGEHGADGEHQLRREELEQISNEEQVSEKQKKAEVNDVSDVKAEGSDEATTESSKNRDSPSIGQESCDQDGEPEQRENGLGLDIQDLEESKNNEQDTTDRAAVVLEPVSPFSSPETKVSGVISDPGDSFGSPYCDTGKSDQETDGENNVVAQNLVKEVLSKTLMMNSDSDTSLKSDPDLDGVAPADDPRPDGAADFADDGRDGDGDSPSKLSPSASQTEVDVPTHRGELGDGNGESELGENRVSKRDGFDESSPEAERVIEMRVVEYVDDDDDDDGEFDAEGEENVKPVGPGSPHPEYPMNYGNYKVCRQVAPGVKECLILETGEFVKYDRKKKRSTSSLSPTTSPRKSDEESVRRSLSESSAGSPKSDTEGEKKAFKIMKTPPVAISTGFIKPEDDQEPSPRPQTNELDKGSNEELEIRADLQQESGTKDEGDSRQDIQDDTQEGSGAEAEQISDVLETSPEEVRSESKMDKFRDSQEQELSQNTTKGILKNNDSQYRSGMVGAGSPVSSNKPPMSPRNHRTQDQRGYRSPPRRHQDDVGRSYETLEQSQGSFTSDYGGSLSGSYLTGRPQTTDPRVYQSMPSLVSGRVEHRHIYQPEVVTSPPNSGPVPGYNTMRDQQVSWLKMFKLLEQEHRGELRAQYSEHQRMIQDIQDQMERELRKQQTSIKQRLDSHRQILSDSSPRADRVLSGLAADDFRKPSSELRSRLVDYSSGDSGDGEEQDHPYISPHRSRSSEIQQTSSLRSPVRQRPPYTDQDDEEYLGRPSASLPVRRSLERDFDSPVRMSERGYVSMESSYVSPRRSGVYGDASVSRLRSEVPDDRLLRGGVYSSPMPISKSKHVSRSTTSIARQSFTESHRSTSPPLHDTSHATDRPFDIRPRRDMSWRGDNSELVTESLHDDSNLSMSTRVNLREKHAKHLSDLREYYETEMAELRAALSAAQPAGESAHERMVQEENQALRLRCQELDDQLHDSKVRNRDLEQKLQGLEIRANDYSARYDESQRSVMALKGRVDELHLYIKDKDNLCADLEVKVKKQGRALQDAYKHQNDLTESNRRDKEALKRLQDKYENLEKDHEIMVSRLSEGDKKVHGAYEQIASLNKTIAKLELHNKQLARENDNLKHKAAIAMNMSTLKSSYEESFGHNTSLQESHNVTSPHRELTNGRSTTQNYRSMERLYVSEPEGRHRVESSPESGDESDTAAPSNIATPSPLLKAEQELRRLQNSCRNAGLDGFEPRLQKKYYGSEIAYPGRYRNDSSPAIDAPRSQKKPSAKPSNSPKLKSQSRVHSESHLNSVAIQNGTRSPGQQPQSRMNVKPKDYSTTRFDVSFNNVVNGMDHGARRGISGAPVSSASPDRTYEYKGQSLENTLSRVRSGDIVSRPAWEDVNTSMAQPIQTQPPPKPTMTKEERLKERLQTVDKLERRYDDLQAEKRKLESALNRIPTHGRNRKMIKSQEEIESGLEKVDREIGSVRMSLKRYQVLKSTI